MPLRARLSGNRGNPAGGGCRLETQCGEKVEQEGPGPKTGIRVDVSGLARIEQGQLPAVGEGACAIESEPGVVLACDEQSVDAEAVLREQLVNGGWRDALW